MAFKKTPYGDVGTLLDDRITGAYGQLGQQRRDALRQTEANAFGGRGMGAALAQRSAVEGAATSRRRDLLGAEMKLRDRSAWANLANELKDRQAASEGWNTIARNVGGGIASAIYGESKGEDTKALEGAVEKKELMDPLSVSIRNQRDRREIDRAEAAYLQQAADRSRALEESRALGESLDDNAEVRSPSLWTPSAATPAQSWRPREATFGDEAPIARETSQESVFKGVLRRQGDPFEYVKVGDSWLTRKQGSPDWTRYPGTRGLDKLEAALAQM